MTNPIGKNVAAFEIAGLAALSEAAEPGPWVDREGNVERWVASVGEYGVVAEACDPDRAFIAALVNAYREGRVVEVQP